MSDLLMMNMLRDMHTEIKSMNKQLAEIQKDVQYIKHKLDEQKGTGDDNNGKESC